MKVDTEEQVRRHEGGARLRAGCRPLAVLPDTWVPLRNSPALPAGDPVSLVSTASVTHTAPQPVRASAVALDAHS